MIRNHGFVISRRVLSQEVRSCVSQASLVHASGHQLQAARISAMGVADASKAHARVMKGLKESDAKRQHSTALILRFRTRVALAGAQGEERANEAFVCVKLLSGVLTALSAAHYRAAADGRAFTSMSSQPG